MEINWLEDFLTLAVTRNFSRAATLRHVTQPAFSRRIRNLEYWVGASLIDRSLYPVGLTPAGEAFQRTAQDALSVLRIGREEALGYVPKMEEVVSISASHTLAVSFFADWHEQLQDDLGVIKARIMADHVAGCVESLISGNCDLMLAYNSPLLPTLTDIGCYPSIVLGGERLVPVSAVDSHGQAIFPLDGDSPQPYLCYSTDSYLGRLTALIINRERLSSRLEFCYECSMSDVLTRGALACSGIAWVPERAVREELEGGRLVIVGDESHTAPLDICLFRRADLDLPVAERIWQACLPAPGESERH
ncbi:HTH-type transcriptional regulator YjiE [Halomonas sp. THAF5a]|uniref:LysR family transcriptional regulator n=1 Tax=Halomonas sp. THAF5a TaxID=2587844 RepID=UPI0012697114|nr:LysR family transcriptional regulator [Halomonas sp. THAF5a]QFU00343.1 HTH-type transcriptional regulator YjiE [Halomonas sp. THAF5a]